MNFFDHTDDRIPDHFRHSYALAISEAVTNGEVPGFSRGTCALHESSDTVIPATLVYETPQLTTWRIGWLRSMNSLRLPAVATREAFQEVPYLTPCLLAYLMKQDQQHPPRRARTDRKPSRKTTGSAAEGKDDQTTPGSQDVSAGSGSSLVRASQVAHR